ncbi:hypothetical protein IW261DRAFT_1338430 [Armillaria novae-zelandiae]|uniref:Nephrocystin 3-like N-terminal domain-containing protein n=1 Tax=Armillaria novae-zelandiae TaxID=153914 RepID=A0AA39P4Y6_9AGAR|nr:hypothetical protein IW261DRAFT_1338430 [Armillaria novae-zelandiae]
MCVYPADGEAVKVVEWLTTLDNNAVQQEKLGMRVDNTGNWFLQSSEYKSWKGSAKSCTLWCPGIPGVGKTILAAIIVEDLKQCYRDRSEDILVLSVFCDYQVSATQGIPGLLRSLLKQVVQDCGQVPPSIRSLYDQFRLEGKPPPLNMIIETLSQVLPSFGRVYLVLDALDEYNDNDGDRELLIAVMRKSLGDNLHLLVTSRDIGTTIGSLFEGDIRLDVLATDGDISLYIDSRLDSSRRLRRHINEGDNRLRSDIHTGVTTKADGMFLLAHMHMESLSRTTNVKSLRTELEELPRNLWDAYDKTLKRINLQDEESRTLALRVFGWIAFAKRPLTVLELRYALAVEPGSTTALNLDNLCAEDILSGVCVGLVVKDETYVSEDFQSDEPTMKFARTCA